MNIVRLKLLNLCFTVSLIIISFAAQSAENPAPRSIVTDELNWISPAPLKGLQFAWIKGNEKDAALYALRVRLEPGTKIPPHRHPDERLSTVLSGTLYVGFGEEFDENALLAIESGDAYVAPADQPHYIWAKDGGVEYQETGLGPTATQIIDN